MTAEESATNDDVPAGAAAFEMALWQLTEQQRSIESLDTKAGFVLTAALALAGLFGASTTLAVDTKVPESAIAAIVTGALAIGAFGWTLYAFRHAVETTSWMYGPEGQNLIRVASEHAETRMRLWLSERVVDSYLTNQPLLDDKARWFSRAMRGVIVQGVVTSVGVIAITVTAALFSSS